MKDGFALESKEGSEEGIKLGMTDGLIVEL